MADQRRWRRGLHVEPAQTSVGEQQHPRLECGDQIVRQFSFGGSARPDRGVEDGVGAAFGDGHHPCLWERGLLDGGCPEKLAGVSGRSRQMPSMATNRRTESRDQGGVRGEWSGDAAKQFPDRFVAQS